MTINEIELVCDRIRKKYNIIIPVEDGYAIAYKMGGHVRESLEFPEGILGTIRKHKESFWIVLDGNLSEDAKKIVIAQLIGILCLYTPYENDEEAWSKSPEIEIPITEEMLINGFYFAKELFMPKYLYSHYFCENITLAHKIDLRVLSKIFELPIPLVRERGIDLKMIVPKKPKVEEPVE